MNMNESYYDTESIPVSYVSSESSSIMPTPTTLHKYPRIPLIYTACENSDRRMFLYLSAFCTFIAGASFGWGPMQLMLENHGIYHSLCSADYGDTICPDQAARLLNINLIAQLVGFLCSPLLGAIADKKGSPFLMNILAVCCIIGNILLTAMVAFNIDGLAFPAFILTNLNAVTAGGTMTVKTGLVFEGKTRIRVISGLNALFPAGGVTYLGLWALQKNTSISLTAILFVYTLVAVFSFSLLCYYWRRVTLPDHDVAGDLEESIRTTLPAQPIPHLSERADTESSTCMESSESTSIQNEEPVQADQEDTMMTTPVEIKHTSTEEQAEHSDENYIVISSRTPKAQLTSGLYLLLMIWFAFYTARNLFTVTTARDFLSRLGDDEIGNLYLSIFTIMMSTAFLAVPLIDLVIDKFGFQTALHVVNLAAAVHGLVQLFFEDLRLQVIGFVAFTIFRCFLYGISFSLLASFLSPDVTGKGAGLYSFAVGLCLAFNIPLSNEAVKNSFFVPNLVYTVLIIPCILAVCILGLWIEKDKRLFFARVKGD